MTAAKTAKRKRSDDQHKEDTGNHPILSGLNQSKHVSSACNMPLNKNTGQISAAGEFHRESTFMLQHEVGGTAVHDSGSARNLASDGPIQDVNAASSSLRHQPSAAVNSKSQHEAVHLVNWPMADINAPMEREWTRITKDTLSPSTASAPACDRDEPGQRTSNHRIYATAPERSNLHHSASRQDSQRMTNDPQRYSSRVLTSPPGRRYSTSRRYNWAASRHPPTRRSALWTRPKRR